MTTSIRIGIAGMNYGRHHVAAFSQIDGAEIVAIADPNESLRSSVASEFGITESFDTADELIDSGKADAIVVATPSYLHERHVGQCFDRGLHVLCESPVGINEGEVSRLVTSAGLVGKVFMFSSPLRFDRRMASGRKLADDGQLGELFQAYGRIQLSQWPHQPDSWRLDLERGGGALLETGLQTLDALWYIMGCPDPMEALASRYDLHSKEFAKNIDRVAEDTLCGMVRFKNGACLQISSHIQGSLSERTEHALSIWGSKGRLELSKGLQSVDGEQTQLEPSMVEECFCAQAATFIAAASDEGDCPNPGKEALGLAKMADALAKSAKEKRSVSIKVERSLDDLFGAL